MREGRGVSFEKATQILTLLLEGKAPKQIAHEIGVTVSTITDAKKMFPLFLGLTRSYKDD
jgi:hypothetical protein